VPSSEEIDSITTLILSSEEIKTTDVLNFCLASEVKQTLTSQTLFRRNSISSKLIVSCLNRFGSKYIKDILEEYIIDIVKNDEVLEIDPDRNFGIEVK
jgi:hypothetical protein